MPRRALTLTKRRYVVRRSPIHGMGLFAAIPYRRGQRIGTYRGPRTRRDGPHVLWLAEEEPREDLGALADLGLEPRAIGIDGRNALRYVNHSRTPNAAFYAEELVALRAIAAGEEITFHYGDEWDDQT